ncbi:NAD(P)/FAD-dependent oxidoreductase [Phaeacidiphilus oryzae]|uniref:NAD(P)/FAD-dependent oxidoreductase n=1 Tax=Phaeacidiphilus oryzae TaxID=348818 RepID=UPI00055E6B88|nr:FAD-dependent oxidoreductase [Phaeacidiphilus oryzae]
MPEAPGTERASAAEQRVVVVGAGLAGLQIALGLRENGHRGPITLVGEELHPPYDRPPLSKDLLLGTTEHSAFEFDAVGREIELRLGTRASGLDPVARELRVTGGDGEESILRYDSVVLATGAAPVLLPGTAPGSGVHLLRTHDDALALRSALRPGARVVIVGAGWIGAEVATAARKSDCEVVVLEAADRPLAGALPAEYGERTRPWYAEAGVELRTGCRVAELSADRVRLADGEELPADAVVLGVGARPATDWLAGSGVALHDNGAVLADDRLRASVPGVEDAGVWAVGDCVSFPSTRYGARLTVHHWDNALNGPRTVVTNMLGADDAYDPVPYFWSDQFGRMIQYLGHHPAGDLVVERGEPDGPEGWSVLWLRESDGVPMALLAVNRPRDVAQGRRLLALGSPIDPVAASDSAVPLKSAVRR